MKYKINILMVEDSEADADLLVRFLTKENIETLNEYPKKEIVIDSKGLTLIIKKI